LRKTWLWACPFFCHARFFFFFFFFFFWCFSMDPPVIYISIPPLLFLSIDHFPFDFHPAMRPPLSSVTGLLLYQDLPPSPCPFPMFITITRFFFSPGLPRSCVALSEAFRRLSPPPLFVLMERTAHAYFWVACVSFSNRGRGS